MHVRHVQDNEDLLPLKHTIDHVVSSLPVSLVEAIRTFIVARAIRLARGHVGEHCSMLVNASRFTEVQRQLRNEIHSRLEKMQASLRVNGALPPDKAMRDPEIADLHRCWEREYHNAGVSWPVVLGLLYDSAAPIKVVEVNNRASGTLNYADHARNGLNVIAVGGFSLSRGLTLEGLVISYFLRNSMMYDTLMQMGRWFGYRPGYEDLCRIWMPEEAEGWYTHIAESIELLRDELRGMEAAGATPEEFGLKVRSHPDTLIVTARNKMGSGEKVVVSIGLANSFVETATLKRSDDALQKNRLAVVRLGMELTDAGRSLKDAAEVSGGYLIMRAPVAAVDQFLAAFDNHPLSMLTDPMPLRRYIQERQDGELAGWDILFASLQRPDSDSIVDTSLGIPINCQRRGAGDKSDGTTLRITNKQRVASRGIERAGIPLDDIKAAEAKYRKLQSLPEKGTRINYPDRIYRARA